MLKNENCVFCKIVRGEIPSFKIYENQNSLAFLDISKDFYGHTLIIPKKHFENIFDITQKDLNSIMSTIKKVSSHFIKNCGFDGVNIFNANGKSASQSVFHLHFHIIPRRNNDKLKIFPNAKEKNYDLNLICEKLKMKI